MRLAPAQLGTAAMLLVGCFQSNGIGDDAAVRPDVMSFDGVSIDASLPDASALDGGPDAPMPANCEAQDAHPTACASEICDALGPPPRVYWNGHSCESLGCGGGRDECEGTDCDSTFESVEVCEAAHSQCASLECRAGGGMWRFWGECDCGFACGVNGDCRACEGPSCDCGPFANFVPERGCVMQDRCIPPPFVEPPEEKCARTGGEWGTFCEHSSCGVRSSSPCTALACDCPGPTEWDPERGCIETERCFRGAGRCDFPGVVCPLGSECGSGGFCVPACLDG